MHDDEVDDELMVLVDELDETDDEHDEIVEVIEIMLHHIEVDDDEVGEVELLLHDEVDVNELL